MLQDPSLAEFLAGTADAGACHWGFDDTEFWGPDEVVLLGDGGVKAHEIPALSARMSRIAPQRSARSWAGT